MDARTWLLDALRENLNSTCGLICVCLSDFSGSAESSNGRLGRSSQTPPSQAEKTERGRWLLRSVEVSLHVVELSSGVLLACVDSKDLVKPSLQRTWIAALQLMETAIGISSDDVAADLTLLETAKGVSDDVNHVAARFGKLENFSPPWDRLYGV
eukprot:SRR837773.6663.p1 GENE.SRR837773.6663~~SRR837773.6663.p1  ORF type:complete len:175 (-),score=37.06 SRR837773.6663:76-540(-)